MDFMEDGHLAEKNGIEMEVFRSIDGAFISLEIGREISVEDKNRNTIDLGGAFE